MDSFVPINKNQITTVVCDFITECITGSKYFQNHMLALTIVSQICLLFSIEMSPNKAWSDYAPKLQFSIISEHTNSALLWLYRVPRCNRTRGSVSAVFPGLWPIFTDHNRAKSRRKTRQITSKTATQTGRTATYCDAPAAISGCYVANDNRHFCAILIYSYVYF